MPIYEYRCTSCGLEEEYLQKLSAPLLTDCPKCGMPTLSKKLSAAGFQLKGSGWYATDFKNNGSGKSKTDKTDKADKTDKTDSKTQTRPSESAAGGAGACEAGS